MRVDTEPEPAFLRASLLEFDSNYLTQDENMEDDLERNPNDNLATITDYSPLKALQKSFIKDNT
jgi:hypothetical protein